MTHRFNSRCTKNTIFVKAITRFVPNHFQVEILTGPNGAISSRLKGTSFPISYLNFPVTISEFPVSSSIRGTWRLNRRGKIAITIFNFTPLNWYFQNTHEMTTWHSCSDHVTLSRVGHVMHFGSCDSHVMLRLQRKLPQSNTYLFQVVILFQV